MHNNLHRLLFSSFFTVISLVLALTAQVVSAKPAISLAHVGKFQPMRTIPSAGAVKEVGGIQYGKHVDIKLKDGTTVRCFPAATKNPQKVSKNWYYLPTNPRISKDKDGTPKFSMVRFVTDKTKEQGGVEGAILHFMVEYGLDKKQKRELGKLLKKEVKGAKLKGAVPLEQGAEGSSFQVVSATLNDKGFSSTLITSGKAPVMEGQKVAVAARLDQYGATLLAKSMENPTTDISVVFDLQYVVKLPAYDVTVTIDYDQFHVISSETEQTRDKTSKTRSRWTPKIWNIFHHTKKKTSSLTETEKTEIVDFLQETGVVKFDYIQHVPDADKEIVESGLHKLVMESFFDMQDRLGTPSDQDTDEELSEEEKQRRADRAKAAAKVNHYKYTQAKQKTITRKSKQVLSLKKVIARYEPHQMVGNIGTWYNKYKDNPKLFSEVNLDDPFFQRREVRFVIDNEAYDIFNEMVNYATVKVRVNRKGQRPFLDEVTIDKKYLENSGQTAMLSYARMGDDAQEFEYASQWSLRGGHLYPKKPKWKKGELMAVTLAAPVEPQTIEAEADLDELEEMDIARATIELRYKRFGKEYADKKGFALSPGVGEPIVSKTIYNDSSKGSDKLEYRVIYHHKKAGKVKDDKWRKVDGGYIYCAPSEMIVNKIADLIEKLTD